MSAAIHGNTAKVIEALHRGDFNHDLRHGQTSANTWAAMIAAQPKFFLGESPEQCPSLSLKCLLESGSVSMHELLPFDEMIIECSFQTLGDCVLIFRNASQDGCDCIRLNTFIKRHSEIQVGKCTLVMLVDHGQVRFGESMWNGSDLPSSSQDGVAQLFGIALHMYELLQCKNVSAVQIKNTKALHAKRMKKNKAPLFDYWVLAINDAATNTASGGKKSKQKHVRLHLRRGHVRNHPTAGKVWVRQCSVGDADLGLIKKDYRINRGQHL